jgi:hypothetical protein
VLPRLTGFIDGTALRLAFGLRITRRTARHPQGLYSTAQMTKGTWIRSILEAFGPFIPIACASDSNGIL